jgi:hypothetical protein
LVATHGAGVEANSFWPAAFNQQEYSWILLPTGRRPWGYDWHGPSRLNVFQALEYLIQYLPGIPQNLVPQYTISTTRSFWTGHSMGGAGCWYLSTHYPDMALGAACVAGFISIEKYLKL